LIGDRAWDSAPLAQRLREERRIELIAPTRSTTKNRKQDGRALRRYKRRWKVEALFARLKRWRRIATRWDFKVDNFFGFVQLGCAVLLLRALVGF
jgi:transposase